MTIRYAIEDLGYGCVPTAINDVGHVVGIAMSGRGFVYRDGRMEELGPQERRSVPHAINQAGIIVGTSERFPEMYGACAFDGISARPLLSHALDLESHAFDIDDAGRVVGAIWNPGAQKDARNARSFLLDGVTRELPAEVDGMFSVRINNQGQILFVSPDWCALRRTAIWRGGSLEWLVPPEGYRSVVGHDLNARGDVVGCIYRETAQESMPFVRMNGEMHVLTDAAADRSLVKAINDVGWIVGRWARSDGLDGRLVIPHMGERLLVNLIPSGAGWDEIYLALAINNQGAIVGVGKRAGQDHGYVMRPVRE